MELSVVIVSWNGRDYLQACLEALAVQTHPGCEVIVVDNGSEDGSVAMVRERFPTVRLVLNGENLGFAEGCNRGIEASQAPWVCMLNNDTVADPGWAAALAEAAREAPDECGMLQSLMLFVEGEATINSTGIELHLDGGGSDRREGERAGGDERPAEIFCPTAGAAAYRRTMLDDIKLREGYFDRSHFMYYEDLDLGWRARLAGWTASYVPGAVVRHHYQGTSRRHGAAWLRRIAAENRMRTSLKNASWPFFALGLPRTLLDVVRLSRQGGRENLRAYGAAMRQALRARREVAALQRRPRVAIELSWARW